LRDHLRAFALRVDADLAAIYGVTTKRLNEQVKRNSRRFPADFRFQLTLEELGNLRSQFSNSSPVDDEDELFTQNRSQIATGSSRHRDPRFLPYAFTENGAVMAANVLNSPQAVRMSVFVVRAFVRMRELLASSKELASELKKLEAKLTARLDVHETAIVDVLRRIMQLLDPLPRFRDEWRARTGDKYRAASGPQRYHRPHRCPRNRWASTQR
jgi:hypothetical protein